MACGVAIKRSLELDLHQSPEFVKRQRTGHCSPFAANSYLTAPTVKSNQFAEIPTSLCKLTHDDIESYLKEEIRQLKRKRLIPVRRRLTAKDPHDPPSPLSGSQSSSDSESDNCNQSFRQVYTDAASKSAPGNSKMKDNVSNQCLTPSAAVVDDQPTFSLTQVKLICNRLLREQEEKLRTEYEHVLETKLAEQYETFVRFTNDQLHRRFEDISLSYVS